MQPDNPETLLEKYHLGIATPEECALVETWYLKYNPHATGITQHNLEEDQQLSLDKLLNTIEARPRRLWPTYAIAASLLVFLTSGIFFLFFYKAGVRPQPLVKQKQLKNDIAPGGNKATLTLANGRVIVLTGAKNGLLASQGTTVIKKRIEGIISYTGSGGSQVPKGLSYNIAATPRGGMFQFILSDGTKVWLNAASSIKFPVVFGAGERKVELTGEAYFEVAHDAKKPFRVMCEGQSVVVLGTHFNVNAYNDETTVHTTLLQGSIKVISPTGSATIKPGEQAELNKGNLSIRNVDVDEAVSWKNGFFYFDNNNIREVMRQLSRWYAVDIRYEGELTSRRFSGEISRNVTASQIMDILSFKKIHYKIDGRSIIVTP